MTAKLAARSVTAVHVALAFGVGLPVFVLFKAARGVVRFGPLAPLRRSETP